MKFKIQTAKYNPRRFTKENREALKKSMSEFSDISGITINQKTGNIVSGNHRWEELEAKHGTITLNQVMEDRYAILDSDGEFTGFLARVVNWPLKKEKQANIVANSQHVTGEWSSGLQDVLQDIALETDQALMEDLRLTDMMIDLTPTDDDLDLSKDKKREKTQEDDDFELDDDEKPKNSEVRDIISTLKITLPSEYKEEALEVVLTALSKLEWYDKVTVS